MESGPIKLKSKNKKVNKAMEEEVASLASFNLLPLRRSKNDLEMTEKRLFKNIDSWYW